MSDEEDKAPEAEKEPAGKSSKGLVVVVLLVAVVLGGGAAAAGAVVAMRFAAPAAHAEPAAAPSAEEKPPGTLPFEPIVVDVRSDDGLSHHLKVVIHGEVPHDAIKEELASFMPRGREAAIAYLRTLTYDEAVSPASFDAIRTELAKRIIEAMGPKRIVTIRVTDFVTQ